MVTAQEMHRLEYWASHEYLVSPTIRLENSGRVLADFVRRRFGPSPTNTIVVLAGSTDNGAGALAAGRHLLHRGGTVVALVTEPSTKLQGETKRQLAMFRKEGGSLPAGALQDVVAGAALVLDGLWGHGGRGDPRGRVAELVEAANGAEAPVVALDVPTGLQPDEGTPGRPTMEALATLTLAFPKAGLQSAAARPFVGELYLGDIALPRALYEELDTTPEAIFGGASIVRLGP